MGRGLWRRGLKLGQGCAGEARCMQAEPLVPTCLCSDLAASPPPRLLNTNSSPAINHRLGALPYLLQSTLPG